MMLPEYYDFFNPVKIISGHNALDHLPHELNHLGAKRPILVTDRDVAQAGLLRNVESVISRCDVTVGAVYDDMPAGDAIRSARQIAAAHRQQGCDAIVAVGGDEVINSAKAGNILLSENAADLKAFEGVDRLRAPANPLVVVATAAGMGAAVTPHAIIINADQRVVMTFFSHLLFPRVAILDPRMAEELPPHIIAADGMDVLTRAMEAYLGYRNPISNTCAAAAVRLIGGHLKPAVKYPNDWQARMAVANAALLSGTAVSTTKPGMVHCLGNAADAVCGIPHGMVMSICLPFGLAFHLHHAAHQIAELLLPLAGEAATVGMHPDLRAARTISMVREFQQTMWHLCGLPRTLKEAGIPQKQLEEIARAAVHDGSRADSPYHFDVEDAMNVLRDAYS